MWESKRILTHCHNKQRTQGKGLRFLINIAVFVCPFFLFVFLYKFSVFISFIHFLFYLFSVYLFSFFCIFFSRRLSPLSGPIPQVAIQAKRTSLSLRMFSSVIYVKSWLRLALYLRNENVQLLDLRSLASPGPLLMCGPA